VSEVIRPRHRVEYAALCTLLALLRALPHRAALGVAAGLARLAHDALGWRRAEAHRRIRQVLGESTPAAEVRRIARVSLRNVVFNAVELARAEGRPDAAWLDRVDHTAVRTEIDRLRGEGRGLIVALVHAGNWDLAGVITARAGVPGVFIARGQKNPLTNRLLNRYREMTGALVVDRDDPHLIRKVVRALGENRMLAILVDLRARGGGVTLPFLGHPSDLGEGLGAIAQLSGAPVLPVFLIREGWTRHRWACGPALRVEAHADKRAERRRILAESLDWLGERVRAHPDQYFWYNKRWVLERLPDAAPDQGAGASSTSVR
jgi:KDO2-lipid IV(A) lauroyltransferase